MNLYLDNVYLTNFAREQSTLSCPEGQSLFESGMAELQQLTYLFLQSENPKEILDDNVYRKRYSKINLRKLVLILEKYSNDKITPAG